MSTSIPTYQKALTEMRSYRTFKHRMDEALIAFDVSTVEWTLLGILYKEHTECIRLSDAAEELGVEASFITVIFNKLKKRGLVESRPDLHDSRAKRICVTTAGKKFVARVEAALSKVFTQ